VNATEPGADRPCRVVHRVLKAVVEDEALARHPPVAGRGHVLY
jgi:hypothetical protein